MNVAELLVTFAQEWGARRCFLVTGGMAMHINKAIADNEQIDCTFVHHEQAAICAAEGWSKSSNFKSIGFACITAGPGVTNSITGLVAAYGDSVPMLILAGQIKTEDLNVIGVRTHGIQEVDSRALVTPAVKKFIRIDYQNLSDQIVEIYEALFTGRYGPVFVEIPLDIQNLAVPEAIFDQCKSLFKIQTLPSTDLVRSDLSQFFNRIKTKQFRLGVVIGNGLRISGVDYSELLLLLAKRNIPTFYTWLSFDLEDYETQNNMGCPGGFASKHSNAVLQECNAVIFLGARLDLATTAFQRETYGGKGIRVFIDIDQKELDKFSRNSDFKFCLNLKDCFKEIILFLGSVNIENDWANTTNNRKRESIKEEDTNLFSTKLSVRNIALSVSSHLESGVIVSASSGVAEEIFTRFLRPNGKFRFFNSAALGAMGQGLSHGIGAALHRPNTELPVLIFEGDGGAWMNVHELATVAQGDLKNFHLFILDNGGYASIRNSQMNHFHYKFGCDGESGLILPDYSILAEMFGFEYLEIKDVIEFKTHFFSTLFLEQNRTIIKLKIDPNEEVGPKLKTLMLNGKPATEEFGALTW